MIKKDTLKKYRKQIDTIDDKILDLLIKRIGIVKNVGKLKNMENSRNSIICPGREADMVRRMAAKSDHNFPKAAIAQMWRLIIATAINIEEKASLSALVQAGNRECFWLAREYFGSFTPTTLRPTMMEVLQDIVDGDATIGILPLWDSESQQPWWSRILDHQDRPKIFAKLPFIKLCKSEKSPLMSIGYVTPEKTSDDESIWVIETDEKIQLAALEQFFEYAGIQYLQQGQCRVLSNPTKNRFVIEIMGFVDEEHEKIKNFLKRANEYQNEFINSDELSPNSPILAHYLGSYATPVLFGE